MLKTASEFWTAIEKENPDTPWAVIAGREKNVVMGMTWMPTRE